MWIASHIKLTSISLTAVELIRHYYRNHSIPILKQLKACKETFYRLWCNSPGTASNSVGLRKCSSQNGLIIRRTEVHTYARWSALLEIRFVGRLTQRRSTVQYSDPLFSVTTWSRVLRDTLVGADSSLLGSDSVVVRAIPVISKK